MAYAPLLHAGLRGRAPSSGHDVYRFRSILGLRHSGPFGAADTAAARSFQSANGLTVDGLVGVNTWTRLYEVQPFRPLLFGANVTREFRDEVVRRSRSIRCDANDLMACMAFESAETFRPDIRNFGGSSGTGLIQFMAFTARNLGTTTDRLAALTNVEQMEYVERYFVRVVGNRERTGAYRFLTLGDLYLGILWPKGVGKPPGYNVFRRGSRAYIANRGLDRNRDGVVTKAETVRMVEAKIPRGLARVG